jgi:hypothetical protein
MVSGWCAVLCCAVLRDWVILHFYGPLEMFGAMMSHLSRGPQFFTQLYFSRGFEKLILIEYYTI